MENKDRMIVPFICDCCGANLNPRKSACDFCRTAWKMVERYRGPDIPVMEMGKEEPVGYIDMNGHYQHSGGMSTSRSFIGANTASGGLI